MPNYELTRLDTAETGLDMVRQLREYGFTTVESGINQADFDGVQDHFNTLLDLYNPADLTSMTRFEVTGKRGGKTGYKRCDEGESKDSFMFYGSLSTELYNKLTLPDVVVDFIRYQASVYEKALQAFRFDVSRLSSVFPSLEIAHFADSAATDVSMRTVIYDDPIDATQDTLVGEPHRDISTFTKQMGQNRPGTFFIVHNNQVLFPDIRPGQAALFLGAGIEDRTVFPDVDLEGSVHTAIMGKRENEERRAVLILLGHTSLGIDTSPSFERTHLTQHDPELNVIHELFNFAA